jgi:acetylornithine deacetylase/succinyl-diaminopimelate desuccinylase-like protein
MDMTSWTAFDEAVRARRRAMVEEFIPFLRLDTVSQQPARVRAGAEWLVAAMRRCDLAPRVLETGGNPTVFGEWRVPGAPQTLLIYCHFDVKPAPPAAWLQPSPFEPVLRRGLAEEGAPPVALGSIADDALAQHYLYARGASDDKGPIWAHLQALELMHRLGMTPTVNVKLVLEGEEEIGTRSFLIRPQCRWTCVS